MFEPAFQRVEQMAWSQVYLRGLLGDATRKNVERMALEQGQNVRGMQHFIGQSGWKAEPVSGIHQYLVAETLGEADGVAIIDESGVVKQGDDPVGVGAQYCGSVWKIANCQVGVLLGYASRKGCSLIEGQLFMPEAWYDDEHTTKRAACGVPEGLEFQTKPEIGLELLRRSIQRGDLHFEWAAAQAGLRCRCRFAAGAVLSEAKLCGLSLSSQVYAGSLSRDLANASLAGPSFILLGSLALLPMVDGGIILKWKLVEAGQSPEQADQVVRKTSLRLGAAFLGLGVMLSLIRKRKLVGGLLAAAGAVGIAAGKGWLK